MTQLSFKSCFSTKASNICVLIVMMIPFEILMLPLYRENIALKLTDSYLGIILPYLANPIAIFFFHQYLKGIPKEIIDSGRTIGWLSKGHGIPQYNIAHESYCR